jgi:hypothetical protein
VADIPNGGVTNFFSLLIESFGYTEQESLLYGTPGGAVEVVTIIFFLYLGDHLRQRILCGFSSLAISELGIILIVGLSTWCPCANEFSFASEQSKGSIGWVLSHASISHSFCGPSLTHCNERRRIHQKEHSLSHVSHRLLCPHLNI